MYFVQVDSCCIGSVFLLITTFKRCRDHLLIEVNGENQPEHLMAYVLCMRQLCVCLKRYVLKKALSYCSLLPPQTCD